MNSGIYSLKNIITGDEYIGSAKDFDERRYEHFRTLKNNTHFNIYLQRAFNKYSSDNFIFKRIFYCEIPDLIDNENLFFKLFSPKYNICPVANSRLGTRHSEKSKNKISLKAQERDYDKISKYLPHGIKNKNPNAKIKDDGIYRRMCSDIKNGGNLREIATEYSVNYKVVWRARQGLDGLKIRNYKWKKLTKDENRKFLSDFKNGMTGIALSKKYGMHKCSAYDKIKKLTTDEKDKI